MSSGFENGPPPDPEQLYRTLSREPFHLTFAAIADLTDYQVSAVLAGGDRPRRKGPPPAESDVKDPREHFAATMTANGWTREAALAEFDRTFGGHRG